MIVICPSCDTKNRVAPERLHEAARCGRCQQAILPLDRAHKIASAEEFAEVVSRSSLPLLVDFWAGWCAPCVMVAPEVERLAKLKAGAIVVAKLNTEELPEVSARYQIRGIPAFILFRDGEVARQASGAMPAEGIMQALGI